MLRLGYACLNTQINDKRVNRTCVAKTIQEKGINYAIQLGRQNLEDMRAFLEWNEARGIRLYRMSSDMLPHATNPEFIDIGMDFAYDLDHFTDILTSIGKYAKSNGHRLTFHPGQYNQLGSPTPDIVMNTYRDLCYHADLLDRMGLDLNSIIVIHVGGVYGDKPSTVNRWVENFNQLPKFVQQRVVIENCERGYNYRDLLDLSRRVNRPFIFDTHHHDCYSKAVEPLPDPSEFLPQVIETWTRHGLRPKFHISEQAPDKRLGSHSDYVDSIPGYLLDVSRTVPIDVMVEAKMKEAAVLKLAEKYKL